MQLRELSNADLTSLLLVLLVLVGVAQILGYLFTKLRQPKVVGEILAGIVLGPALLGHVSFGSVSFMDIASRHARTLSFIYWLGLLLLMFLSGAETRQLFTREERGQVGWLAILGTGLPFVIGLALGPWLAQPALAGPNASRVSLVIVLAVGVAVTSVPVISKIFADLKILNTRFARLVLGVAVLEDIVLWAALAIATALAGRIALPARQMALHILATAAFFVLGLTVLPRAVKRFNKARANVLAQHAPVAYALAVLFGYCILAGAFGVSMVFAAFLAGFAVVHKKRRLFADALDAISKVSFGFLVPIYFAIVGLQLDLVRGFSWRMLAAFLIGSCLVKLLAVSFGARMAGFRGLEIFNLAITTNARGGPGIVLASVAFDAGIISTTFYTTLVLTAVLTSQFAGAWLDFVVRKGWPLLLSDKAHAPERVDEDKSLAAA